MASENDVNRAARDIGTAVIDITKTAVTNAARAGQLDVSDAQLGAVIDIIDQHGRSALAGAFKTFLAVADERKDELARQADDDRPKA